MGRVRALGLLHVRVAGRRGRARDGRDGDGRALCERGGLGLGDADAEPERGRERERDGEVALRDVFLGSRHAPPEPAPRDPDAAVRRWAFTFPSDDPVKRIDLVFAGLRGRDAAAEPLCGAAEGGGARAGAAGGGACLRVDEAYVVGQDATPGTEMGGGGMVAAQSPIWASDHRGVAVDFDVA